MVVSFWTLLWHLLHPWGNSQRNAASPGSDPFTSSQRSPFGHSSERQSPQSTYISSHTQSTSLQLYFSIICSITETKESSIMSVPRLALCPHPPGRIQGPSREAARPAPCHAPRTSRGRALPSTTTAARSHPMGSVHTPTGNIHLLEASSEVSVTVGCLKKYFWQLKAWRKRWISALLTVRDCSVWTSPVT